MAGPVLALALASFAALTAPGYAAGLRGEYYARTMSFDNEPALVRVDEVIDFDWGEGAPSPEVGENTFCVRWMGFVLPPTTEEYTFFITSDDGSRLWLDGRLIDNWGNHSMREASGRARLEAGVPVRVRLDYYENMVFAGIRLEWESPSRTREVVPAEFLFPPDADLEPPVVADVAALVRGRLLTRAAIGDIVEVIAVEHVGESGLAGVARVRSESLGYDSGPILMDEVVAGVYLAMWDTLGLKRADDYMADVALSDGAGNRAEARAAIAISLLPAGRIRGRDNSPDAPGGCAAASSAWGGAASASALVSLWLAVLLRRQTARQAASRRVA